MDTTGKNIFTGSSSPLLEERGPGGEVHFKRRTIVHMDLDTFFVAVERLTNSKLIGKPVIIGGF